MSSDYEVRITEEELEILNQALEQYLMSREAIEGLQSEIDKMEALLKKLNQEKSIRQDLMNASDRGDEPIEFTESEKGYRARDRWAERYDDLNGAPESDDDR